MHRAFGSRPWLSAVTPSALFARHLQRHSWERSANRIARTRCTEGSACTMDLVRAVQAQLRGRAAALGAVTPSEVSGALGDLGTFLPLTVWRLLSTVVRVLAVKTCGDRAHAAPSQQHPPIVERCTFNNIHSAPPTSFLYPFFLKTIGFSPPRAEVLAFVPNLLIG